MTKISTAGKNKFTSEFFKKEILNLSDTFVI